MEERLEDAEKVSITGKLILENGEFAKIENKGVTYTLRASWDQLIDLGVKDGITVTVDGSVLDIPMQWDGKEKMLHLDQIVINGKATAIDYDRDGGRMHGGMKGNRGKRTK